jgi:arylsulfatase A-like enzyme
VSEAQHGQPQPGQAQNAVVILLDSLNRHLLGAYGSEEFATPNLDRFAARAVRFDRHHVGSLPCMPARHDLLVGAMDFLWRPWGSIELWEEPITRSLRRSGVVTQLVTDHPHLFEVGGENYHCEFTAWDYQRGHESDPWRTRPDPSWVGAPDFRRGHTPYDDSRGWFRGEEDFPGPRTMAAAARWLERDAPMARGARPAVLPVRRRVRSARTVRHARPVRVDVRRVVGGPAPHLAALHERGDRQGHDRRAPGPPDPRRSTAPSSR